MREIGIIKWFSGINRTTGKVKGYGFIARVGQSDLFIHKTQIRCPENLLLGGTHVAFEVGIDPIHEKEEAKNLLLLKEEPESEDIISQLIQLLRSSSYKNRQTLALTFPDWVKQHEELSFLLLPPVEQITALIAQLPEEYDPWNVEICSQIAHILPDVPIHERQSIISRFPLWIKQQEAIFPYLPIDEQIIVLSIQLGQEGNMENDPIISQIAQVFNKTPISDRSSLISLVPDWLKITDAIISCLPRSVQVSVLATQLQEESVIRNEQIISRIKEIIKEVAIEDRLQLLSLLPNWVIQNENIFNLLPPVEQVNSSWSSIDLGDPSAWNKLSREAKILCVYRAAKENVNLPSKLWEVENDPLVKCAILLLWAKDNPKKKDEAFKKAHGLFQDYVVDQAWKSTESLQLDPLLPRCSLGVVQYCEGRPWPTEEDKELALKKVSRAFCPRVNRECSVFHPINEMVIPETINQLSVEDQSIPF